MTDWGPPFMTRGVDENAMLREKVRHYEAEFRRLNEAPHRIGVIASVDKSGKRGVLVVGGNQAEVPLPADVAVGDEVRVLQEGMRIVGKLENPFRAGPLVDIDSVQETTITATFGGGPRMVSRGAVKHIEPGWRGLLDPSGLVLLEAMPPEPPPLDEHQRVTWDDIGGLDDAKEAIREAIEYPITHAEVYARYGKKPSKGVLLYGPPGCGKTLLGRATATALQGCHQTGEQGFIYVKGPELLTKWVGESEGNVRKLFDQCRTYKRKTGHAAVLFIDEADALLASRSGGGYATAGYMSSTVVPSFLAEMDGLGDSAAFVMLATNRPDILDSAVTRDGRIDRRIEITRPGRDEVQRIFAIHLAGKPTKDPDLLEYATQTVFSESHIVQEVRNPKRAASDKGAVVRLTLGEMVSGAMIAGIVARATEIAIKREREGGKRGGITKGDLSAAIADSTREMRRTDLSEDLLAKVRREAAP